MNWLNVKKLLEDKQWLRFPRQEEETACGGNVIQLASGSTDGSAYSVGTPKPLLLVQPELRGCFGGCGDGVSELVDLKLSLRSFLQELECQPCTRH